MSNSDRERSYWKDNLVIVSILLIVWFVVAFVGGIFAIEWLNQFKIGYLGAGFWVAQQGSIFVFVLIVLFYALWMDRLDRKHGVGDQR